MKSDVVKLPVLEADESAASVDLSDFSKHDRSLPPSENNLKYPALDGLRAVSVILVFVTHYLGAVFPTISYGWAGVSIFFALSGFLITGILYDTREAKHRFRNFYMRRSLRILPLYYGILLAALLTTPIFHWFWNRSWWLWATYLGNYTLYLLPHNALVLEKGAFSGLVAMPPFRLPVLLSVDHLWSLSVEEQFYLVWPLVVFLARKRETLVRICVGACVLCPLIRLLCFYTLPVTMLRFDFLERATPLRLDALLIGGLAALLLRGPQAERLRRISGPLVAAFAVGFVLLELAWFIFSPQHKAYQPDLMSPTMTSAGFSLVGIFAAVFIVFLLTPEGFLFRLFNVAPLRQLGRVSYGFYIFHLLFKGVYEAPAQLLAHSSRTVIYLTAVIGFVATYVLALLSYRYFETPFLRLKRFFA